MRFEWRILSVAWSSAFAIACGGGAARDSSIVDSGIAREDASQTGVDGDVDVDAGVPITRDASEPNETDAGEMTLPDASLHPFTTRMTLIPAGTFMMGSERTDPAGLGPEFPVHEVTISRPFWLGTTEVTQLEYQSIIGVNPSHFKDCGLDCPVDLVSWGDSIAFLNELSRREGLEVCYDGSAEDWTFRGVECAGYRMPTEAEWEYAVRAGTSTTAFYAGDITVLDLDQDTACQVIDPVLDQLAWYCANSGDRPHPAGMKMPNAFGLYDMLGNTWEWVNDWQDAYIAGPVVDPVGPDTDDRMQKMRRGGAYRTTARMTRSATRVWDLSTAGHYCIGFRVARTKLD
jgi:formylglycine-generating enzyme required for sulfatase activity